MGELFQSGIRPAVDDYLQKKSEEKRDYGDYWSASSAGYCQRRLIMERLGVPPVADVDARKTRVFEVGHIFHQFMQDITKDAGLSVAQEKELKDTELMIIGHFDDLVIVNDNLMLIDYKTQNSRAFNYKRPDMSHYHKMQLGTYMYMLRNTPNVISDERFTTRELTEARIIKISKDDLRMSEEQLLWTPALEKEVVGYWKMLNGYWLSERLPKCTCADYEGGFLAKEAYNPFFYQGEPCSTAWYAKWKESNAAVSS